MLAQHLAMDAVKMSHRANPDTLPSIHRSTGVPKISDYHPSGGEHGGSELNQSQNRATFTSARSYDQMGNGRLSNTSQSLPAAMDTSLPSVGDDESIDLGRITIERRSQKQLLPPSVSLCVYQFVGLYQGSV